MLASAASPSAKTFSPSFHAPDTFQYTGRPVMPFDASPAVERRSMDTRFAGDAPHSTSPLEAATTTPLPSIRIRRLPPGMTHDGLMGMLLFAEDLVDAAFAVADDDGDRGFIAAVARFRNQAAADEARSRLHGKMNSTRDATLVVEALPTYRQQRSSGDSDTLARSVSNATNPRSPASNGRGTRPSSRFNSTFQSMSNNNNNNNNNHGGQVLSEAANGATGQPQNGFDATSPRSSFGDGYRPSGKYVISRDGADDDAGSIIRDSMPFASNAQAALPRRQSSSAHQNLPLARMANLTLNTDASNARGLQISPPSAGYRSMTNLPSSSSEMSPTAMRSGMMPTNTPGAFAMSPQHLRNHHYPPANPADQNPPCNTLYVGNLPMDTSEDELKAVFSKQRGYKRLCFRTKHNGPMCFVEFEDVSFATKALNELYGHPLHNSVKGGIRLSFSKNPLGVRSGQASAMGPNSPLGSPTGLGFGSLGAPPGFSTANGPPPGLSAPPGLASPPLTAAGFFTASSPTSTVATHSSARGPLGYGQPMNPAMHPQSPTAAIFPDSLNGRG